MGNNQSYCHISTNNNIVLNRQLSLYRWRLDHSQLCIPKIEFKQSSKIKQQQHLNQFIESNKNKLYFSVNQLQESLNHVSQSGQSIIVFEKYACTLDELHHSLQLEETVYTLECLLTAFQCIKKIYTLIPVSKCCCFVTLKGEVRGWINSNPKNNQIEEEPHYKYFEQRQYEQIVDEIIGMVRQLSVRELVIELLFDHLKCFIRNTMHRCDIFQIVKNQLKSYCCRFNIGKSYNLCTLLRRKKELSIIKFMKKSDCCQREVRQTSVAKFTIPSPSNQINKLYQMPSQRSYSNSAQKSVNTFESFSGRGTRTNNVNDYQSKQKKTRQIRSEKGTPKKPKRFQQSSKSIKSIQRLPSTKKPCISSPLKCSQKYEGGGQQKYGAMGSTANIFQIADLTPSATLLGSKLLTSKQLSHAPQKQQPSYKKHRRQSAFNTNRQKIVSIVDLDQDYQKYDAQNNFYQFSGKENKEPRVHFKTAYQINDQNQLQIPSQSNTTKTICGAHQSMEQRQQQKGRSQNNLSLTYSTIGLESQWSKKFEFDIRI